MNATTSPIVPFHRPYLAGSESANVVEVIRSRRWEGDGPFTERCQSLLARRTGANVLLTSSGTHALELALAAIPARPGDEVILPSYTFAATATCVVRANLTPVLVDVCEETLNIDPVLVEAALTDRTRAVIPVHYGGIAADMETLGSIAERRELVVVEDAAHAVNAFYQGRPLGALGAMGVYSFHQSKNVSCGQGGAVLVNHGGYLSRLEVAREVGTDRARFLRGEVHEYGWVDSGSNYMLAEVLAGFLLAQLEALDEITARRRALYDSYLRRLAPLAARGDVRLPRVPADCQPNGHFFHLLVDKATRRQEFRAHLRSRGIETAAHYVPLHTTAGGQRFGVVRGTMQVSELAGSCLVRLPLYTEMTDTEHARVVEAAYDFFAARSLMVG